METTFITIHDLSLDAKILYASSSIFDILGYRPEEVVGRVCWDYFHPDEIPFAQAIHGRGIQLDKASMLNYCQIKSKNGHWVGCECVFTIVYNVLVGCTSVYKQDARSENRAVNAPIIRQLFSSSPKDPRYHMLSYISSKFSQGPRPHIHEPRAALFLNRFTRTLTIMYATDGLNKLLNIPTEELVGKSFYYCIQENCLPEAVRCLESAKANDSIAYLRFWYRDPRLDDANETEDEPMCDAPSTDGDGDDEDEDGGVQLASPMDTDSELAAPPSASSEAPSDHAARSRRGGGPPPAALAKSSSGNSPFGSSSQSKTPDPIFDPPGTGSGGSSRTSGLDSASRQLSRDAPLRKPSSSIRKVELEAVISCTSDGLVVVLRAARPLVLESLATARSRPRIAPEPSRPKNGFFASPWAVDPPPGTAPQPAANAAPPAYQPQAPTVPTANATPNAFAATRGTSDALAQSFMETIREAAVFAWALTGINGSLAQFARGRPRPGAQPYGGLPVWERDA